MGGEPPAAQRGRKEWGLVRTRTEPSHLLGGITTFRPSQDTKCQSRGRCHGLKYGRLCPTWARVVPVSDCLKTLIHGQNFPATNENQRRNLGWNLPKNPGPVTSPGLRCLTMEMS